MIFHRKERRLSLSLSRARAGDFDEGEERLPSGGLRAEVREAVDQVPEVEAHDRVRADDDALRLRTRGVLADLHDLPDRVLVVDEEAPPLLASAQPVVEARRGDLYTSWSTVFSIQNF